MLKSTYFQLSSLTVKILSLAGVSILAAANPGLAFKFNSSTTNTFGDVLLSTDGVQLTNAFSDGADDPTLNFNLSGNDPFYIADLELELGLPDYSLDPDPDNFVRAAEGSAIATTISVAAGDVLSFNWNFFTNDSSFVPEGFGDYAFFLLNDTLIALADTNIFLTSSLTQFNRETDLTSFSHTFLTDGDYTIGFGVIDVVEQSRTSSLAIADLQLTRERSEPIPEPSTTLGILALAGLGFSTLRRK